MPQAPEIAVIIPNFSDRFQREYWPSIHKTACERGVRPIYFIGSYPRINNLFVSNNNLSEKEIIYRLAASVSVDGYFIAQTVKLFFEEGEFDHFYNQYIHKPVVMTLSHTEESYTVVSDNYQGMYDLVNHFVNVHKCENIVFIKGSPRMRDAKIRFDAFCDAMKKNSIPVMDETVIQGTYIRTSGKNAVKEILDVRKLNPDAIICANDEMAFGVLDELLERGIEIPETIKVGGFDNITEAEFSNPPLTTVVQPIGLLAEKAMHKLVDLIENKFVEKKL